MAERRIPPTMTADGFQNLVAGLGTQAANLQSQSTYAFSFRTRNRTLLEAMYRGSWIVTKVVNIVADDMTRAGISLAWPSDPDAPTAILRDFARLNIWTRLNSLFRWARLYGGAIAIHMVDGQKVDTPLNYETIKRGQYRGLHIMDRWMIQPSQQIVNDIGIDFGKPVSYNVINGIGVPFSGLNIHHSRVIRAEGLELPYLQRIGEQGWGMSVLEPLYDRMIGFDTATAGTANLIHKAHLRTIKIPELRALIATGGSEQMRGLLANIAMIRELQTSEGITLLDKEDDFEAHSYTFAGLTDVLREFAQQLSGAADIPITRLFGQAPAGLNATGDSDLRNYYDKINQGQESQVRDPMESILQCVSRSALGMTMPEDVTFTFAPLWQLSDTEKAGIASQDTGTVLSAHSAGLIPDQVALRELQHSGRTTGRWGSITDEDVANAEDEVPDPTEMMVEQAEAMAEVDPGDDAKPDKASSQIGS